MVTYYSDHFATPPSTGIAPFALPSVPAIVDAGRGHGRLRVKRARINAFPNTAGPDTLRFMKFSSGDRLHGLELSTSGPATALTLDIGLALAGINHDGAVLDADLFASAGVATGVQDRVDLFDESAILVPTLRGAYLWQIASSSPAIADMTEDPRIEYEVVGTCTASTLSGNAELIMIATYTAGD